MYLSGVHLSVYLSHPAVARCCCAFAAVRPARRRYRSIAARLAPSSIGGQMRAVPRYQLT